MKALELEIFKNRLFKGCSNNGISEKYETILIAHPRGFITIDENNPPENFCKVVEREIFGKKYLHVEPVAKPNGIGWMDGGAVVYSCDGRFGDISQYPLCLHDRQETPEQYDILSR